MGFRSRFGFPEPKPSQRSLGDFGLEAEEVSFPTVDRSLPGWFVPAQDGRGPAVILVHGWESNHARMLPMAHAFHDAGLHAFLFDARGHGGNPAKRYMTAAEFVGDVAAALEYVAIRREVDKVGLFGHSAGGTASILAASRDSRVRAVVSSSAFAGPVELTQRLLGLGGSPPGGHLQSSSLASTSGLVVTAWPTTMPGRGSRR
ncbi:MAG: alpha/beta hydrolase [Anaerolineae bacterium]